MEINNFVNAETLITFGMTIIMVELWVGFTKELPYIKRIPTKFYTFILTVFHLAIINSTVGLFAMTTIGIYTLLCNALIIAVILNGGYDIITKKITITQQDKK